jgi:hypothetical protein
VVAALLAAPACGGDGDGSGDDASGAGEPAPLPTAGPPPLDLLVTRS